MSDTADVRQVPPQSLEAERAVLGSLLLVNEHIGQVIDSLSVDEFHARSHRVIYRAILDLYNRGEAVDFLTLRDELRRKNELETAGGVAYVSGLTDVVPAAANVQHYSRIVRETATRRRLIRLGCKLAEGARSGDLGGLLAEHQAALSALEDGRSTLRAVPFPKVIDGLAPITWLWPGWLPVGFSSLLVGSSGIGKSALALALTRCVLTGEAWPDGTSGPEPGPVLWVEAEGAGALLRDRVVRWGIPPDNLLGLQNGDIGLADVTFADWHQIRPVAEKAKPRLIIVDSLSGFSGGLDENKVGEVSPLLLALQALARDLDAAVLTTHHLRKRPAGEPDQVDGDRVRGSSAIVQFHRSVLGIDQPSPEPGAPKRLLVVKSNLAAFPPSIGFRVGESGVSFCSAPRAPSRHPELDRASDWLRTELSRGAVPAATLYKRAAEAGVNARTLRRACRMGGIVVFDRAGVTCWGLQAEPASSPPNPATEPVPF